MIDRPFLSVAELADLIGVSRRTIYNLCWRKEIPFVKIGNTVRIHRDVVRLLAERGSRHPDANAHGQREASPHRWQDQELLS